MTEGDPGDLRTLLRAQPERNDARGVGLQGEMNDVVPLARALDQLRTAEVAGWGRKIDVRLGRGAPVFILLQRVLSLADRSQKQIEALAIVVAHSGIDRFDLISDIVENALSIFDSLK